MSRGKIRRTIRKRVEPKGGGALPWRSSGKCPRKDCATPFLHIVQLETYMVNKAYISAIGFLFEFRLTIGVRK